MEWFDIAALLLTIAAVFRYINYRFVKLPTSVGLMLMSLTVAMVLIVLRSLNVQVERTASQLIGSIDFEKLLLNGMLALLLFAGALHVNINDLLDKSILLSTAKTL